MDSSSYRLLNSQPNYLSHPTILLHPPHKLPRFTSLRASSSLRRPPPVLHFAAEEACGGMQVGCARRRSSIPELGQGDEEKAEFGVEEEEEEEGVVELMECLEKEAIMGKDEGRDPTDYNRRAEIFGKSSRVFQALKAHNPLSDDHHQPQSLD